VPVFVDDEAALTRCTSDLLDNRSETFRFSPPDLKPGSHVITVRVVDSAGNVGTGDVVFAL
jgi:hypothetical protein